MAVITISRELGSGGADIGQLAAKSLGYDYVDKRTIDGIFRQYGLTKFDDLYNSAPGILDIFSQSNLLTISMLNEMIEALAQRGKAVIVGRGGFAVLGDYADVLNVRIEAPASVRAQRILDRENLATLQEAEARVAEDDSIRSKFVHTFYNKHWNEKANFDLVLDTSAISNDMAANQIVDAVKALEQKSLGTDAITTASIKVDPVLADAVAKVVAYPLTALSE